MEINIFISYRTADRAALLKILQCLKPLELSYQEQYNVQVKIWYDENEIITGDDVQPTISENLDKSHIVICIFTPRYFESKWCTFELKQSVNQTRPPSKKRVVPIIYEEVNWDTDWLGGIKAFPSKEKGSLKNWTNEDEALVLVSKEIDENIKIFADPKALDFRNKRRSIVNALKAKPDFPATVKSIMCLVDEHLPDDIQDAVEIHIIYDAYESKEDTVKLAELTEIRINITQRIFKILKKGDDKYGVK